MVVLVLVVVTDQPVCYRLRLIVVGTDQQTCFWMRERK